MRFKNIFCNKYTEEYNINNDDNIHANDIDNDDNIHDKYTEEYNIDNDDNIHDNNDIDNNDIDADSEISEDIPGYKLLFYYIIYILCPKKIWERYRDN